MRLESNIDIILTQMEGLRAEIPLAVARVLRPARWIEDARAVANRTLSALATPEQVEFIPDFILNVIAAALEGGGLSLQMRNPFPPAPPDRLGSARADMAASALPDVPSDWKQSHATLSDLFAGNVRAFQDAVEEWVKAPEDEGGKDRDARDASKSDQEVANLITWILLTPHVSPEVRQARAALEPYVTAFLAGRQAGLDAATVDLWLRAVLLAWREMVLLHLAARLRAELKGKKLP